MSRLADDPCRGSTKPRGVIDILCIRQRARAASIPTRACLACPARWRDVSPKAERVVEFAVGKAG